MNSAYAKKAAIAAAVLMLAIVVTGCQLGASTPSEHGSNGIGSAAQQTDPDRNLDSPQQMYDSKDNEAISSVSDLTEDESATVPDATTESSSGKAGKTVPSSTKAEGDWNAKAPKLLGFAIGDAKSSVRTKLGKPSDTYTLDDDDAALTVEEYAAYSIGYAPDQKVKYVEVFDKSAATGLSGLRVGDSETNAVKKLGKPDTHTSSVIAYEAAGALLKLDLDPQNSRVLSIKLFSADDQP